MEWASQNKRQVLAPLALRVMVEEVLIKFGQQVGIATSQHQEIQHTFCDASEEGDKRLR